MNTAWERVARAVPEEWLPTRAARSRSKFVELGCGVFGCVMPTSDPKVVLKLTSDVSEAKFAAVAQKVGDRVPGIVGYHKVVHVEGFAYRKRPIYLLWRQAAKDVGFLQSIAWGSPGGDYDRREASEAAVLLRQLKLTSEVAFSRIDRAMKTRPGIEQKVQYAKETWSAYERASERYIRALQEDRVHWIGDARGAEGVGVQCVLANNLMGELINNEAGYAIGEGAQVYLNEEQILLADLHLGNIGKDEDGVPIITDPGLAIQVGPKWLPPPEIEVV